VKKKEREGKERKRRSLEDWANTVNDVGVSGTTKQFVLLAGWP